MERKLWVLFLLKPETIDHLLFSFPMAKVIWGIIAICFIKIQGCLIMNNEQALPRDGKI
jgi:hypothetical protein